VIEKVLEKADAETLDQYYQSLIEKETIKTLIKN